MATLKEVLAVTQQSVPVFPLRPGTKDGYLNDASDHGATTDSFTLYEWFKEGGPYAGYNFGCSAGGDLLYIDVDSHNDGLAAWETLAAEIGWTDRTFTVASPRGGRHYYFRTDGERFGQVSLIKGKIDVRSAGGYVVGPGSTFTDPETNITGSYSIVDPSPIAPLPAKLRERLRLRSAAHSEGPRVKIRFSSTTFRTQLTT